MSEASDRLAASEETYARLFGPRDPSTPDNNPEFSRILRTLIFGDVFATGDLPDSTRELITVTVLACLNSLPQLRSHTAACLHTGVSPVQIQEAVYQLATFMGFPLTLNAIAVIDEVFVEQGIELPLPSQSTTTDENRFERGRAIQGPLYGTEIADELASGEPGVQDALPRFLTEFLFGDFYSRNGLDIPTRELLVFCALATFGLDQQLRPHVLGALKVGHSVDTLATALIHCFPYIGFPKAINAMRVLREVAG